MTLNPTAVIEVRVYELYRVSGKENGNCYSVLGFIGFIVPLK